jgi:hypothetical protein
MPSFWAGCLLPTHWAGRPHTLLDDLSSSPTGEGEHQRRLREGTRGYPRLTPPQANLSSSPTATSRKTGLASDTAHIQSGAPHRGCRPNRTGGAQREDRPTRSTRALGVATSPAPAPHRDPGAGRQASQSEAGRGQAFFADEPQHVGHGPAHGGLKRARSQTRSPRHARACVTARGEERRARPGCAIVPRAALPVHGHSPNFGLGVRQL